MKLYYPITIDLYKVYPLQVMEAQQGNVGRGAIVTLTAGGAVVDPTNEDVEVYAKKPDGTVSWLECSVEDAKVKMDFTNQMLMSPGVLQVELRIKNETDDITTPIFMVQVNKSNVQNAGRSENELPLLDQIKKNADDAKAAAEAAEKAVGDKITNPNVGAVGQILEIETVDEKGKPLTYKAADKPEGGVDEELSQIIHESKYGIVSDGVNDTVIAVGKDAAAGDVIRYIITENSGDITVIYDNGDTGEFNISSISHAGEETGEKTLTAEKYCTYTFPSEIDVYLPFNIPSRISQLADDVGVAKQHEVSKLSEDIATKASAIKEKASGETIVVTDSDEQKPLGLAIDGKSEQNQYSGKNTLDCSGLSTYVNRGVTFTPVYKDNGELEYILANGTNDGTSESRFVISGETSSLKDNQSLGEVVLSGCPSGGGASTYRIVAYAFPNGTFDGSKNMTDYGVGADANSKKDWSTVDKYYCAMFVSSGATVNNLKFYPMISVEGGEYEPFVGGKPSPSTEYEQKIRNIGVYDEASGKYKVEVKFRRKNAIKYPYFNTTINVKGVDFTVNNDGSVTVNGTPTGGGSAYFIVGIDAIIGSGKHILSGCPSGGSATTYRMQYTNMVDKAYNDFGNGVEIEQFDYSKYQNTRITIIVENGYKAENLTFFPMIRPVGTDGTHEPCQETTATVLLDEPLRKGDKAYWNGGSKIRIDRYRCEKVVNGETSLLYPTKLTNTRRFQVNLTNTAKVTKGEFCDKLILKESYADDEEHFYFSNTAIIMFVSLERLSAYDSYSAYFAENPYTFEYDLDTPITEEIDIDLGELSMFYPTTIISNDCNANMEVEYIADTKAYIDKKFAELATAMV